MAKLSEEARKLFEDIHTVTFSTADAQGQPNACIVAMKRAIDDETLYLSDQFFNKTLANLRVNPKVSIVFMGEGHAFQIHGTARYVNDGPEYEEQEAWALARFKERGRDLTPKGGCFVTVDALYEVLSGPHAGERLV